MDILPIHHYLSTVVIQGKGAGKDAAGAITYDASAVMNGGSTGIFDIFGSNYAQINKAEVESKLKSMSILLSDEKVEMAFKCGRYVMLVCQYCVIWLLRLHSTKRSYCHLSSTS